MFDDATIAIMAAMVDDAQANGHTIPKLTDRFPGLTVEDGYAVLDALFCRWQARGRVLAGYKAGLTSRAKMLQMGVNEPSFGLLMRDTCEPDGGTISTRGLIHPRVEAEIAYVMKDELSGSSVTVEEVHAATDFIQPALEILDSRFEKFSFDLQSVIADNSSSARFVLGGRPEHPREMDPAAIAIEMAINDETVASATSAAVLGHPARAVQILVAWLHRRGKILPAGAVVMTGAATEAIAISTGDSVCVRYQGLGSINVRID
ncbi:MAG TPA: fumarylacetoacetate hydrolase family protein [Allosphingosinicella sp.]|nr:fumarylacetoacetate hydrolase family protein [Allosphingosinicella sp.]